MPLSSVLALPGTFSLEAADVAHVNFSETLNLLLESKTRTKALTQKGVDLDGYYIKVTCNLNAHVTKTVGGNGAGAVTGTNDDMYEFSALKIKDEDFSSTFTDAGAKYMSQATEAGTGLKAWDNAAAFSEYRLKKFQANVQLGLITLNNQATTNSLTGPQSWKVSQTVSNDQKSLAEATVSAKNLMVFANPVVAATGNNQGAMIATVEEDVTVAQYLYVTSSGNGSNAQQNTAFGGDSKYNNEGNNNSWIETDTQSAIDQLEDKLGVNITVSDIEKAYKAEIDAVKAATTAGSHKIITDWEINIGAITGPTSKFSAHARSVYASRAAALIAAGNSAGDELTGGEDQSLLFTAGDKIVLVHPDNHETAELRGETIALDLELTMREQNSNGHVDTKILSMTKAGTDEALRFVLQQQ